MELRLTLLRPADYAVTRWSGGTTTQLAIAPAGADYADRDFLWRVSSAVVELDESDFTALPNYRRLIAPLRGEMVLSHNGGAELSLRPGEVHDFDGADATHSRGRCTDFNLMLRKGKADGTMRALRLLSGRCSVRCGEDAEDALLYCAEGECTVRCGAWQTPLHAGEAVRAEHAQCAALSLESEGSPLLMFAQMRQL